MRRRLHPGEGKNPSKPVRHSSGPPNPFGRTIGGNGASDLARIPRTGPHSTIDWAVVADTEVLLVDRRGGLEAAKVLVAAAMEVVVMEEEGV